MIGEKAFRMKLDAMQRIAAMGQAHDDLIPGPSRHHQLAA
jgi:hypothetical protein